MTLHSPETTLKATEPSIQKPLTTVQKDKMAL